MKEQLTSILLFITLVSFGQVHESSNGNVGIGTTSPSGKLHVSTGTSDDAIFRLEADTDNNNESDNPLIQLRQDGGQAGVNIGFSEENFGSNVFGIGTRYSNSDTWNALTINTSNGEVGIGTSNPDEKMHINGTTTITGDIGVANDSHWKTGYHTLELQNSDAGDVVLSFHRAGHTNAAIKHSPLGGLILSGSGGFDANHVFLKSNGYLGIGTTAPDSKLTVKGNIHAEEVKVDLSVPGPDYVFKEDYDLKPLEEVQNYIKENGHLPNIPSAQEMEANGIQLGEMDMKLLEKIEELTLYIIKLEKENKKILEIEKRLVTLENKS